MTVLTTGEHLATIQRVRHTLAETGPSFARGAGDFERVSLPMEDGDVLRDLLIEESACAVIEIGLAYGSSALAIGEALVAQGRDDARHMILDPYQDEFANVGWEIIIHAELGGVGKLVAERSQLVLPRLVTEGFKADAAFVDGSHVFHNVFVDLYFLRELVRPSGVIVLDDYQWASVATAVRYFVVNAGWKQVAIDEPTRLRAFRLPDPRVEPSLEEFRPFGIPRSTE